MNYWVIADTHFGHERMHKECGRPEGFETRILANVKRLVKQDDVLIHLGDVCIGQDAHWNLALRRAFRGKQWLIRGNHDKKSTTWYLNHGWDCVIDSMTLCMFGKNIFLSHIPINITPLPSSDWVNVHGHHHNTLHHPEDEVDSRHRLVIIEHDYAPVKLERIVGL